MKLCWLSETLFDSSPTVREKFLVQFQFLFIWLDFPGCLQVVIEGRYVTRLFTGQMSHISFNL